MSASVFDKVRKWIDGESAEGVLEDAARDAQIKPRSRAEEFIVKIARSVEGVMQDEMVPLPQGTTIIPCEYTIFLSNEDDKEWQGRKRSGLEQGLYHILAERAKEIAGKKKLETKSFVIELRVDGTLEKDSIRVQHSWEDSSASKTGVLARPKPRQTPSTPDNSPAQAAQPQPAVPTRAPDYVPPVRSAAQPTQALRPPRASSPLQQPPNIPATVPGLNIPHHVPDTDPSPVIEDGEELTNVRRRSVELYKLEVWLNGVRQNVLPIFSDHVVVGRGSKSRPVDITLAGDPEISRRHVSIHTDGNGKFWVVNEGRNAAAINNVELPQGQKINLAPGVSLAICSYVLRIQPRSY